MPISGGCYCGAIRYRASAAPISSLICHCQTCREVSSAPLVAWITFMQRDFELMADAPAILHSSANVVRTYCAKCGTPISYKSDQFPEEIDITTCSLDDPAAYPPTHHSWVSEALSWIKLADGLPQYAKSKLNGERSDTRA
jgi:hypothetical protein